MLGFERFVSKDEMTWRRRIDGRSKFISDSAAFHEVMDQLEGTGPPGPGQPGDDPEPLPDEGAVRRPDAGHRCLGEQQAQLSHYARGLEHSDEALRRWLTQLRRLPSGPRWCSTATTCRPSGPARTPTGSRRPSCARRRTSCGPAGSTSRGATRSSRARSTSCRCCGVTSGCRCPLLQPAAPAARPGARDGVREVPPPGRARGLAARPASRGGPAAPRLPHGAVRLLDRAPLRRAGDVPPGGLEHAVRVESPARRLGTRGRRHHPESRDEPGLGQHLQGAALVLVEPRLRRWSQEGRDHAVVARETPHQAPVAVDVDRHVVLLSSSVDDDDAPHRQKPEASRRRR